MRYWFLFAWHRIVRKEVCSRTQGISLPCFHTFFMFWLSDMSRRGPHAWCCHLESRSTWWQSRKRQSQWYWMHLSLSHIRMDSTFLAFLRHHRFVILVADPPLPPFSVSWVNFCALFVDIPLLSTTLRGAGLDLAAYLIRWLMWLLLWCLCCYFANLCIGGEVSWVGQRSLLLYLGHCRIWWRGRHGLQARGQQRRSSPPLKRLPSHLALMYRSGITRWNCREISMAGRDISLWPPRYQPVFIIPVYYLSQFVSENCTIWLNSLHFQITQPGLGVTLLAGVWGCTISLHGGTAEIQWWYTGISQCKCTCAKCNFITKIALHGICKCCVGSFVWT